MKNISSCISDNFKTIMFQRVETIVIRFQQEVSQRALEIICFLLFIFLYIISLFIRCNRYLRLKCDKITGTRSRNDSVIEQFLIQCALLRSFKFSFLFYLFSFVSFFFQTNENDSFGIFIARQSQIPDYAPVGTRPQE